MSLRWEVIKYNEFIYLDTDWSKPAVKNNFIIFKQNDIWKEMIVLKTALKFFISVLASDSS